MRLWLVASILLIVSSTQSIGSDGDHAIKLEKVKKVYAGVKVNTSYSPWSVDAEFLSISLSPKRVIGSRALPWYSSRLQVCTMMSAVTLAILTISIASTIAISHFY